MYAEDSLMPPSAFLQSLNSRIIIPSDERHSYNIGFDKYQIPLNRNVNNCSQTDNVKTCSKASSTSETVITLEEMKERISINKAKYDSKIELLNQQNISNRNEMNDLIDNLNRQLLTTNKEKSFYEEELNKMKYYISGIENRDTWLQEKHRLLAEIDQLDLNGREQQSIINALRIQLSNMEKIQSIQERELEKDIVKSNSHKLSSHEVRYESLLRAWRHKVLALFVQQESHEVVVNKERHQWKTELQERQNEIEHLQNVLETINLKLESNEAHLTSMDIIIEKLKRENACVRSQLETMNEEKKNNHCLLESVYDRLEQFHNQMCTNIDMKFQKSSSKLDVLERRLQYATSRFPMIQAGIIRTKNIANAQSDVTGVAQNELPVESLEYRIRELEESLLMTSREMHQLKSERDHLIVTIENDSATFNERVNAKKHELDEEMTRLQSTVAHLEKSLNKSLRELDILRNENIRIKLHHDELLTEKCNETENFQAALSESRNQLSALSLEFSEFKRSSTKEKNKLEEKVHQCEQRLADRESFWTKHSDQLNAESNLLKMTIRQEGILSKLKTRAKDGRPQEPQAPRRDNHQMESVIREVEELAHKLWISDGNCS